MLRIKEKIEDCIFLQEPKHFLYQNVLIAFITNQAHPNTHFLFIFFTKVFYGTIFFLLKGAVLFNSSSGLITVTVKGTGVQLESAEVMITKSSQA